MKLRLTISNKPSVTQLHNSALNHNSKVKKLRQLVSTLGELDFTLIRMFFGGKQLEDDETLLSYCIKENSRISITLKVATVVREGCLKDISDRAMFQPDNILSARCQKYWCWVPAQVKEVRVDETIKSSNPVFLYKIEYLDPVPKDITRVVEVYKTDLRNTILNLAFDTPLLPRSLVMVSYPLIDVYPSPQQYHAVIVKVPPKDLKSGEMMELTLDLIVGENTRHRVITKMKKTDIMLVPRVVLLEDDEEDDSDSGSTGALDEREKETGGNAPRSVDQKTCDFCIGRRNVKNCTSCGCNVCGIKNSQPRVYCDECMYPFHNDCAQVPVGHVGDWYCQDCSNEDAAKELKAKTARKARRAHKRERGAEKNAERLDSESSTSPPVKKKNKNWGGGMATAARNKVCKKVPIKHVGKIPGVLVGSSWRYRITCSESGIHRAPVAGIHGTVQKAFSIVISGGYDDDVDNGDSFIYSGSGGRLLTNNARTAEQSHDQTLQKANLGLAMTCAAKFSNNGAEAKNWKHSQPVRVVRSSKALKIGKYAPTVGNRYDGLYKLKKYWPSTGKSGHKVYLFEFHRDDTEPAPWTKEGKDVIRRHALLMEWPLDDPRNPKEDPMKRKPAVYKMSKKVKEVIAKDVVNKRNWDAVIETAKHGIKKYYDQVEQTFLCGICFNMLTDPVSLQCTHNFCMNCWNKSIKKGLTTCPSCRHAIPTTVQVNENLKQALQLVWKADI